MTSPDPETEQLLENLTVPLEVIRALASTCKPGSALLEMPMEMAEFHVEGWEGEVSYTIRIIHVESYQSIDCRGGEPTARGLLTWVKESIHKEREWLQRVLASTESPCSCLVRRTYAASGPPKRLTVATGDGIFVCLKTLHAEVCVNLFKHGE
jgi:hypothetical protein